MIVGIDPGTTVGYAFLDLYGKIVHVGSARGDDREKLIGKIMKFGKPVLFATDVSPAPDFVLKVAANFNARVFEPQRDLTEREKGAISKGFAIENLHERDAVACALKAYHNYENKFRQIDALAKERGIVGKEDHVKRLVLEGVSVQKAVLDLKAGEETVEQQVERIRPKEPEPDPEVLRKNEKIRELLSSNEELKKALMRLESDKKILQGKLLELERGIYERVMRDREMRKRDARIRVLAAKQAHRQKRKNEKGQSGLKALAGKKSEENDEKKVDIDSIIMRYRQKSLDR